MKVDKLEKIVLAAGCQIESALVEVVQLFAEFADFL